MLVLHRTVGEKIIIGDNVEISILKISQNNVKIGVEAPKDISVHREEIYEKIKKNESGLSGGDINE